MQFERREALRISIGVKCESNFVARRFFSGARRWRRRWADELFFPLVVPGQIFARATKREKIVRPDFLFAALSTGLSTAAGKMALSFAARQTAFEQTTPSQKKGALLR